MSVHKRSVGPHVPALQADAVLSQASPVSGTKYTVLAATKNVRIMDAVVMVTWTVQPDPLETHWTVDGITWTGDFTNPVSATNYYSSRVFSVSSSKKTDLTATTYSYYYPYLMEARSVKIEAETTGGTVSQLDGKVRYAKW